MRVQGAIVMLLLGLVSCEPSEQQSVTIQSEELWCLRSGTNDLAPCQPGHENASNTWIGRRSTMLYLWWNGAFTKDDLIDPRGRRE